MISSVWSDLSVREFDSPIGLTLRTPTASKISLTDQPNRFSLPHSASQIRPYKFSLTHLDSLIGLDISHYKMLEPECLWSRIWEAKSVGPICEANLLCRASLVGCLICLSQWGEHSLTNRRHKSAWHAETASFITFDNNSTSDYESDVLKIIYLFILKQICRSIL